MSKICLIGVQGPLQLCAGRIAMEWFGKVRNRAADTEAVLLLYDFLVAPQQEQPICEAIMQIASAFKWKAIVFISGEEMKQINSLDRENRLAELRSTIGLFEFDEIYLARNYIGVGSSLILNAYPAATRITYGDGFGLVGTQIFAHLFGNSFANLFIRATRAIKKVATGKISLSGIYSRVRGFITRKRNEDALLEMPFDVAILILPVDYSGVYLDTLQLYVPPKELVTEVMHSIGAQMPDLNAFCNDLIKDAEGQCYLYLFITPTESGCTSLRNEVTMYLETIRENSPPGSSVYIKLHPRKPIAFADYLVEDLQQDYKVVVINQGKFKSIPVEFWTPLINSCNVVSFSSSSLNLAYIYSKDIISGFSIAKIRKYFFRNKWEVFEDDYHLWTEAIEALEGWDNQSVLWKRGAAAQVGQQR